VTVTTGVLDDRDDATLIAAVRDGDTDAYGALFERHVDAARRLARSLARNGDADDLVSEAFAKVLPVLVRGDGPEVAFRPYLLTAIRRLDVDRHRALARSRPTDDESVLDEGEPFSDTAVAGFESAAAARAFASLPERWQLVLWHTEVEGQRPAAIAPLLGLSPNGVSQLAHRAREGLRQAFVSMHVQDVGEPRSACQATRANLGAYIRAGLSAREANRVSAHLECCRPCTGIYLELLEVDTDLRGLLAPLLLGGAAAAYLSEVPVSVAPTAVGAVGEFLRSGAGKALAGTAAAGLTLTALVLGGVAMLDSGDQGGPDSGPIAAPPRHTAPARQTSGGGTAKPGRPTPPAAHDSPTTTPYGVPTTPPSSTPTGSPGSQPTHSPTDEPSDGGANGGEGGGGSGGGAGGDAGGHGQPTDQPDPSQVDVGVTASHSGLGPAAVVTVNVTGLSSGQPGLVTITADHLAATVDLDPRCDLLGVNRATCRMNGAGSLQLLAASLPLVPTTLTITAAPGAGLSDPSTGDNTTSVVLG
jgi:RNA polymerase sigma factor (sigma-70 family)